MSAKDPVFQLTLEDLERIIALIRGIEPDVDHLPDKAKYKIDRLAKFFEIQRDALDAHVKKK